MPKRIYVGNLPFTASDDEVQKLFEPFGPVESVKLATDRQSGRPRGFGFVTMMFPKHADAAIEALQGQEFGGRPLNVSEVKPRGSRPDPHRDRR